MKRLSKSIALLVMTTVLMSATGVVAGQKDLIDTAVSAGSFKTLATALQTAGLVDALKGSGPFTVFAPTDEAFAKLPAGTVDTLLKSGNKQQLINVLTYHVVKGKVLASAVVDLQGATTLNGQRLDISVSNQTVQIDDAKVIETDIECSNGVIHVIDTVMLPSSDNLPTTASEAGNFETLLTAAKAAGLVAALTFDGPLTVFAPTDDAFAKLPEGTIASLLKPENKDQLAAILKYHVVPGRIYATDALKAGNATTLQGGIVRIRASSNGDQVNDANLIATDIDASNGVIHVIDAVLLPSDDQASSVSPQHLVVSAINKGAPLYNAGHSSACAKVYMKTVASLLAMDNHGLSEATVHTMHTALKKARHTSCSSTQAWALRHALDLAYNEMKTVK